MQYFVQNYQRQQQIGKDVCHNHLLCRFIGGFSLVIFRDKTTFI
jgi:hypothetical protein